VLRIVLLTRERSRDRQSELLWQRQNLVPPTIEGDEILVYQTVPREQIHLSVQTEKIAD
jgi:hypothetical protein